MGRHPPLILWRLLDGRRGHLTQILGLTQALADRCVIQIHDIPTPGRLAGLAAWAGGYFPVGRDQPDPHLILAAGHSTHLPAMVARRARGGRIVVLMKPSLPLAWFDLCLIPEHDAPPQRPNVIATRGVLTTVRPSDRHDPDTSLILLGGPSRHYDWRTEEIIEQVQQIVSRQPGVHFRIGDSPRTPADTRLALAGVEKAEFIPWEQTEPGEIQQMMAGAGQVWVSEDSVSMLYESLGSGAPTGLLQVPRQRENRVTRGIDHLIAEGTVTPYAQWRTDPQLPPPPAMDEAGRCAEEILRRWPAES